MNVLLKRRQLIMATLVIALGAAVFVNWYFTRTSDNVKTGEGESENYVQNLGEARYVNANKNSEQGETAAQDAKADDSFAEIKLNRTKAHDEALDCLKSSLDSAPVDSKTAESVAKSVDELSAAIKCEADTEALISSKIGASCVVVINNDKIQVVVEKGKLNEETALIISDIVASSTDIPRENLMVSEAK